MLSDNLRMPRHPYSFTERPPTSREINTAIEAIRAGGAPFEVMALLDLWNATRLVDAARKSETNEELRNLFAGIGAKTLLHGAN